MNLAAYDKVEQNITKTWINPRYNRIYSNELEHYSFYTFLKKYNKENDCFDYFLAMYNKPIKDNKNYNVIIDNDTVKLNLFSIINEPIFKNITNKTYINIEIVNKQPDGIIYKLNILDD